MEESRNHPRVVVWTQQKIGPKQLNPGRLFTSHVVERKRLELQSGPQNQLSVWL